MPIVRTGCHGFFASQFIILTLHVFSSSFKPGSHNMLIPAESCLKQTYNYNKGNKNLYIEEQTTQWPKEKIQKDKQRSTKHTHKTKD